VAATNLLPRQSKFCAIQDIGIYVAPSQHSLSGRFIALASCPISSLRALRLSVSAHFQISTKAERTFRTMDEITKKAIAKTMESRKLPGAVKWRENESHKQGYFGFDTARQTWALIPEGDGIAAPAAPQISRIKLYSWNIDFMVPFPNERMRAALDELKTQTSSLPPTTTAAIVFLQECLLSDLNIISEQSWIRDNFYMTDMDTAHWGSDYYGTTTLIDRRLAVASCFRVHYLESVMERDALCVDVSVGGKDDEKIIRFCNTHLESLALHPPYRPHQMRTVAKQLCAEEVHAGIAAGDFNAIQPFDRTLHSENGLKDAYLELGGKEDSDEGYTWGQQAATRQREMFGCSRMDKMYFTGELKLLSFDRFGQDVQLTEEEQKKKLVDLGFDKPWITDHLGITAEFELSDKNASINKL
jgi:tyrosyl-DNA phosphodiesterase 2